MAPFSTFQTSGFPSHSFSVPSKIDAHPLWSLKSYGSGRGRPPRPAGGAAGFPCAATSAADTATESNAYATTRRVMADPFGRERCDGYERFKERTDAGHLFRTRRTCRTGFLTRQRRFAVLHALLGFDHGVRSLWNLVLELDRCRNIPLLVAHEPQNFLDRRLAGAPRQIQSAVRNRRAVLEMKARNPIVELVQKVERRPLRIGRRDEMPEIHVRHVPLGDRERLIESRHAALLMR